jgi:transposase
VVAAADVHAGVPAGADAAQWLAEALARTLTANEQLAETAAGLRAENEQLRGENEQLRERLGATEASLAVLQRMVFGRSSEKSPPAPRGRDEGGRGPGGAGQKKRGKSGNRRRDYSGLPRFEVIWDFDEPPCCGQCGMLFAALGGDDTFSQVDWQVVVRLLVHRRRRYRRACSCTGPRTVTAPGPPKAIGKGLFSNAFIAMLLTERYVAGRSQNSLVTGLARHGVDLAPGTVAGLVKAAGALLAPLEEAVIARSRDSWHLHADETTWQVFVPREGDGPARWWLWVFLGPDTTCFVMDPTRAAAVLARHAGIDQETGQLAGDGEDGGPRQLVLSSDFYSVYTAAGKKADGLVNLFCWAHIRRHFVRAGDANPAQLTYWTQAWLERIKALYACHRELMSAWAGDPGGPRTAAARARWDEALAAINTARTQQAQAPGLQEPAKKALATLDREWDGLAAHRDYPMLGLDNNPAERAIRRPVVTRKNARGSHDDDAARLAARAWTVTATAEMHGLNAITYLTAWLDECGRNGGKPLTGPDLERFLPWTADPADLETWKQPPRPG